MPSITVRTYILHVRKKKNPRRYCSNQSKKQSLNKVHYCNKRVRSSSGRSQLRLRATGNESGLKLLRGIFSRSFFFFFSTITVFNEKENCGHKDFYIRKWGFVQSLAAVAVHISCRNGGRGFALRIIVIVQVRTVHVLTFFNFILFQHWKDTLKRERSRLNLSIEKILKQEQTGSQANTTGFVPNILWMDNLP